jgi:hypothetical protein
MTQHNPNPLIVAGVTGITTSAAVLIGWCLTNSSRHNYLHDWRDVWVIGTLGTMLGAHWSVTGKPWFGSNY